VVSGLLPTATGHGQRPKTLRHVTSIVQAVDLKREDIEGAVIVVSSEHCLEATVTVTAELDNMIASQPLPWTFVMTRGPLHLQLAPIDPASEWNYRFAYRWRGGGMKANHNPRVLYRLPYPPDTKWRVSQGNLTTRSHAQGTGDDYAIDWAMPEESTVCAARSGTVVAIK